MGSLQYSAQNENILWGVPCLGVIIEIQHLEPQLEVKFQSSLVVGTHLEMDAMGTCTKKPQQNKHLYLGLTQAELSHYLILTSPQVSSCDNSFTTTNGHYTHGHYNYLQNT